MMVSHQGESKIRVPTGTVHESMGPMVGKLDGQWSPEPGIELLIRDLRTPR